ncbi:MAG: 23S rRNA (guanosine(2251)-2'-O)-methyltransferase RlmB [Clostridia bacterium]|nr:23S rRNA (guanosine(2251)-2'-O)-methyltransferase RlmB [Clostridia bacterium]MDY4082920.1 23S rRNA (guanosine(2251)-2'-O)-methyltransferase RlmB [Eubacteriales bacterium]
MQAEGKNAVTEALDGNVVVKKLYVCKTMRELDKIIDKAKVKNIPVAMVEKRELDKMSETGRHQGVIAVCKDFEYTPLDDVIAKARQRGKQLFLVLLDGIEDPHNLGSIIRVAECLGADAVVIPSRRAVGVTPTVIRVSAGATNHLPICQVGNINDAIRKLKDEFVGVICADMDGEPLNQARLDGDIAIVVGNEGSGVKALTAKLCDKTVAIPQFGKVNSLNASVACGIICYEIVRQRLEK